MNKIRLLALGTAIILTTACSREPIEQPLMEQSAVVEKNVIVSLFDATNPENKKILQLVNASISEYKPSDSKVSVNFHSQSKKYSGIVFKAPTAWDWSSFQDFHVAFDIENSGLHSVQLYLDMSDIDGNNYTRTVNIPAGSSNTYYAKMSGHDLVNSLEGETELNFASGLRSNPDTWVSDDVQFTSLWGKKNLNLTGISQISLSVQSALFDKTVSISKVELRKNPKFDTKFLTGIVDKFGQNAKQDFPSKIHSKNNLVALRNEEYATFTGAYANDRSKWGGWLSGPKLKGTGYFTTTKYKGKWSLVDPDGYLYFATGIDIIRLANSTTMTGYDFPSVAQNDDEDVVVTPDDSKGLNRVNDNLLPTRFLASELRKSLFTWLPDYDEPLGKHYGYRNSAHSGPLKKGETYSFYSANLDRKYSEVNPDYIAEWRDVTLNRMQSWGFTSLGNWTDPSFYSNERVPFFANGWIIGDFKTISSGNDFWAPLPDVFDPKFERRAMITANVIAQEVKNTSWCVGIFVDNEKSFGRSETNETRYGLVIDTLKRDGNTVPTKAAFTKVMKEKYGKVGILNKVWGKNIDSWDAFERGVESSINNDEQLKDYSLLLTTYAEKYYSTVDKALNKHLPNHMYLGSRFPDWGRPAEVVRAAAKYVDVVSYNVYKEGIHPKSWNILAEVDMPSIIGEFHIGAKDSGLFHPGLIHAANQDDRAKMYADYMGSVIDNPYFIGAHWFQYMDSPITGRAYDGENYNVGFVSVTDSPYKPLVSKAQEVHSSMYERRFSQ